jgi:hypothetical protein
MRGGRTPDPLSVVMAQARRSPWFLNAGLSIARLLRRENPAFTPSSKGYFPPGRDRTHFVRTERDRCFLALRSKEADWRYPQRSGTTCPSRRSRL